MRFAYTVCVDKTVWRGIPTLCDEFTEGKRLHRVYRETPEELTGILLELHEFADRVSGAAKCCLKIKNTLDRPVRISKADVGVAVENGGAQLHYFSSNWGREFDPLNMLLTETHAIHVLSGRSSKGFAPWVGLECSEGFVSMNIGWSGNWQATTYRRAFGDPALFVCMGIGSHDFYIDIPAKEEFEAPEVYISASKESMEDASFGTRQYFIDYVSIIDKEKWDTLPVCYNTWWCYEDRLVNENKCLQNAVIGKDLGITNFMMDAGWFGNNADGINWYQKRGDWDIENLEDFPHGLHYLGEAINKTGVKFGIWCEIEAVGEYAELNHKHPEFIAKRDGQSLGYVCMGNPAVVDWAIGVVDKLVTEYGAHWIKFDFNLDPNSGCNCTNHGHGEGDGLYAHYKGYYRFLETLHQRYPDLILENCCSGGLRMDFGILARTHFTFLSDPDYVDNHFQTFWGATAFIHPAGCYHFTQSESCGDINGPDEPRNPISADMSQTKFDFYIRSSMMSTFGLSYDLPSWPDWCKKRLKEHIEFFKSISKDYILCGSMHRLTGQALRYGKGDRFQAYQFNAKDNSAYVFLYKLKGAGGERRICLKGLEPERFYHVRYVDRRDEFTTTGAELMEKGVVISGMEESSEIIEVR
ncbi:alpha-galactosidase [Massiliimalia timonensis]|uniref:alpha-galactosidase n=1 Tax=Massiliimalia timonensis TaxID=1987501 RepID=UPI0018A0EA2B|nr:alpha-galactosidase [Massiliimalia timonensis]